MQTILSRWGLILGTAVLALAGSPALAQTGAAPAASTTAPADAVETTPHTHADLFSMAFPAGWQVREQETTPQVVATSPGATATLPAMRTEVVWQNAPPRQVVGASLQEIQTKGYSVIRYDAAAIDGVTAVRLWLVDLPGDLPNAFITYVGYADATAIITTYYGPTQANLDSVLMGIHSTFARSR